MRTELSRFSRNWRGLALAASLLCISAPKAADATTIVQVAVGSAYSCALDDTGNVWCWGRNHVGQLGDGSFIDRDIPQRVPGLQNIQSIASGANHVCAVRANNRVSCWGGNFGGQVGNGLAGIDQPTPVVVQGLQGVAALGLGAFHSCALMNNGRVQCWGRNMNGQLGDGTTTNRLSPVRVVGLGRVSKVVAGQTHTCAIRLNRRAFCWGTGIWGQLGAGPVTVSTVPVLTQPGVIALSSSNNHSCVVRPNGTTQCWGSNFYGQVGTGTQDDQFSPVRVQNTQNASGVAAGGNHSCLIHGPGRLQCWGQNLNGQLGAGFSGVTQYSPLDVLQMQHIVEISLGFEHSCALRRNGNLFCWGSQRYGQIGNGVTSLMSMTSPVAVSFP